jgi:hypothetical protein
MMKKYITFILLAIGFLTSCSDFLDTNSLTSKSTENFPYTEDEANELITGIYANLLFEDPEVSSYIYTAQLAGDDCLGGNLEASNNCATNFLMYTNLNMLQPLYARCYKQINRANVALETLDNVNSWSSQAERNRCFGEAYFLRAFAFNELVQMFGGVPLRIDSNNPHKLPRASVDEVYEQIASDLKNAIELMPDRIYLDGSPLAGHATKYAAEAMMARVFLFYTGRYGKSELPGVTKDQVIAWIDDCVNNSGHDLVQDQRNLWSYTNKASEDNNAGYRYNYVVNNNLDWAGLGSIETVFANKHKLKGNNWTYTWFSNTIAQFFSPSADNSKAEDGEGYPFGRGWGAGPVSPAMVNEWKSWSTQQSYLNGVTEDPRLTGSIWSYRALDPNVKGNVLFDRRLTTDEPDYTVSYRYYEQTGYHQKKYINVMSYQNINASDPNKNPEYGIRSFALQLYSDIVPDVVSQSLNNIADLIHIRFADVLLMQSELKGDATGLNRVRARSNLAPIGYSLEAIKNERRWELAFESIRWWDLLRWSGPSLEEAGDVLNKQTGFTLLNAGVEVPMVNFDYKSRLKQTQGYWPIPQTEIDLSDGLFEQNPGWGSEALFTSWNRFK